MTYTIIGTGNMAWFLVRRLKAAGYICNGVYGRNEEKSRALAAFANSVFISDLQAVKGPSDCCIIAVTDRAIEGIARELFFKSTVVIHTAGTVSIDLLSSENKGVLWPVYSILKNDLPKHTNIPIVYEANNDFSKKIVLKIAHTISDIVYEANEKQRQWLHLTAVFGNNFTNHLAAICEQLCKEQQLPFFLLLPILKQTFERMNDKNSLETQTGPAKRNDVSTISKHIQLLQSHPHLQQVYKALTASIKDMYNDAPK